MFKKLLLLFFILLTTPSHTINPRSYLVNWMINKKIQNKIDVIIDDSADIMATLAINPKVYTIINNINELADELICMQEKEKQQGKFSLEECSKLFRRKFKERVMKEKSFPDVFNIIEKHSEIEKKMGEIKKKIHVFGLYEKFPLMRQLGKK